MQDLVVFSLAASAGVHAILSLCAGRLVGGVVEDSTVHLRRAFL